MYMDGHTLPLQMQWVLLEKPVKLLENKGLRRGEETAKQERLHTTGHRGHLSELGLN